LCYHCYRQKCYTVATCDQKQSTAHSLITEQLDKEVLTPIFACGSVFHRIFDNNLVEIRNMDTSVPSGIAAAIGCLIQHNSVDS
jgi:hypothetical protein